MATASPRRLATTEGTFPPGAVAPGTRGEILATGLKLFAERGFGGTSVRDIARVIGINPATLYAHFPSKEHVLAEITRIGHEEHQRCVRAGMLESSADSAEQLTCFVRAHVQFHATHSMLAVVCNTELHMLSGALAASVMAVRDQTQQLLIDIIERGKEQKAFNVPDTWLTTAAIGSMGLRVAHWYSSDDERTPDELAEVYAMFALRIAGVRGGKGR